MGFLDFLSDDPTKAGEKHLAEGDVVKAVAAFFKAGDHKRAFQIAIDGKQAELATQVALHMVLGKVPAEYADATPLQAADLLFSTTHYHEALALFEVAEAWKRAADTAAKLQLLARAARLYEKARLFPLAATYYKRCEQLTDTLRMLERESTRLRTDPRARREASALEDARKVDQERAELMRRMGRGEEAATLIRSAPPTSQGMEILESGGRIEDAIQGHIRISDFESALALLPKVRLEPAQRAAILLACRKPLEAATAFVQAGDLASAARASESGGDSARAARLWEQQQKPAEAAQAYRRARQWENAARCAVDAGDLVAAAEAFRESGDAQRAGFAYLQAGQALDASACFLECGDRPGAIRALRQIAGGTPEAVSATLTLARLLYEQEEFDDGLLRLEMLPNPIADALIEADRLLWQGRFLERLDRKAESMLFYRKVLVLRPGDPIATTRYAALKAEGLRTDSHTILSLARGGEPGAPALTVESVVVRDPVGRDPVGRDPVGRDPAGRDPAPPDPIEDSPPAMLTEWTIGTIVAGRYEILTELGRGGMGRVYRAHDRELGEEVAIKVVLSRGENSTDEARLRREVQIARRLTHPRLVRVFDLGRFGGQLYITMEIVEGQRLDIYLRQHGRLPLVEVREIAEQMAAALAEAHGAGVVHRDLKPENVFLTQRGVKILDFGIARPLDTGAQLTQAGYAIGTPAYMSPEQVRGDAVDGRSDLYALGVLIFHLLCGRAPFEGDNPISVAMMHLDNPVPDLIEGLPDAPAPWRQVVARLLQKEPGDRFATATEAAKALSELPT